MERSEVLVKILKEKYGITTLAQLNKALAEQKSLDLSPFVTYDGLGIKKQTKEVSV